MAVLVLELFELLELGYPNVFEPLRLCYIFTNWSVDRRIRVEDKAYIMELLLFLIVKVGSLAFLLIFVLSTNILHPA